MVDDEAAVRDIAKLILESHGYRCSLPETVRKESRYSCKTKDNVRLVVSDMNMPFMNGAAMIRSLERIQPNIPVLSASGRDQDGTAHQQASGSGSRAFFVQTVQRRTTASRGPGNPARFIDRPEALGLRPMRRGNHGENSAC